MDFVDIHTHILPGLDDGAPDMRIASEMIRIAYAEGIRKTIMTPHHITGIMENRRQKVEDAVARIKEAIKGEGIEMEIFPGSEICLDANTVKVVENGSVCTLNDSRYVLIELPLSEVPAYTREALFELKVKGYVPILAHPERNSGIMENPLILHEIIQDGSLVQVNSSSLEGLYGRKIRLTACALLRLGLVHFVATDAHSMTGRKPFLKEVYESVEFELGTERARKLFIENGLSVIRDEAITLEDPVKDGRRKGISSLLSRLKSIF